MVEVSSCKAWPAVVVLTINRVPGRTARVGFVHRDNRPNNIDCMPIACHYAVQARIAVGVLLGTNKRVKDELLHPVLRTICEEELHIIYEYMDGSVD